MVGLAVVATTAQGQRRVRGGRAVRVERPSVGARIGYDFDVDHVFIGGQPKLPGGGRWGAAPAAGVFPGVSGPPFRLHAGDGRAHGRTPVTVQNRKAPSAWKTKSN